MIASDLDTNVIGRARADKLTNALRDERVRLIEEVDCAVSSQRRGPRFMVDVARMLAPVEVPAIATRRPVSGCVSPSMSR